MAEITLKDLNDFADRLESNSRQQVNDLRDEMRRMEKGVYHRIDEIKRALEEQDDTNEDQNRRLTAIEIDVRDVKRGFVPTTPIETVGAEPAIAFNGKQKAGIVVLAITALITVCDMLGHAFAFAGDLVGRIHR